MKFYFSIREQKKNHYELNYRTVFTGPNFSNPRLLLQNLPESFQTGRPHRAGKTDARHVHHNII